MKCLTRENRCGGGFAVALKYKWSEYPMATFPTATNPNQDELPTQRAHQLDAEDGREIVHDLMNHLTVIDLCAFQLRSTVNPFTLAALERAVEGALRSAKRLSAGINPAAAKPSLQKSHKPPV